MSDCVTDLLLALHISVHSVLEVYKATATLLACFFFSFFFFFSPSFFFFQLQLAADLVVDSTHVDTETKNMSFVVYH